MEKRLIELSKENDKLTKELSAAFRMIRECRMEVWSLRKKLRESVYIILAEVAIIISLIIWG